MTTRRSVTVRVPATTANLGPGFDCLGMAVDLWNELTVTRADRFEVVIEGEGAAQLPRDASNLVVTGVEAAFRAAKQDVPTLRYELRNTIPFARGLGSSSAAIVSGLIAGLAIAGHELAVEGSEELLQLAAAIEGHPDNVAPAIYGGVQLGIHTGERWYTSRVAMPPGIQCVLFVPDTTCETSEARALLADTVPRKDAVFNMGRTALLVKALTTGNMNELRFATQDRLHQPPRAKLIPHLFPLVDAALSAGAHGAFLSGAGPTIMALTSGRRGDIFTQRSAERKESDVVEAMRMVAEDLDVGGRLVVTRPTEIGAHVTACDPPMVQPVVRPRTASTAATSAA